MCSNCSEKQRKCWLFGVGVFLACCAIILGLIWPNLGQSIVNSKLKFKNGSMLFNSWLETPIPIHIKFHLFNWTNPEKVNNASIKPHFEECGPYVFTEKHTRVNLTWHDNGTISYNQIRTWHFDESLSNGSLDDMITFLNPVTATVVNMMKDKWPIIKEIVNKLLIKKGGTLTATKKVREVLFDGYEDPLLAFLKKLNISNIPFNKFGWFFGRNNSYTYDGRFTMFTDQYDATSLGYLTHWNGRNLTGYYEGECGKVFGSSGELWPRQMKPNSPKSIFIPDLCRTITLNINEKFEKYGLEGSQYTGDNHVFDNGHIYKNTRCFCPEKDFNKCPPTGVLDISKCKFGAPAAMSYPHFYLADPRYVKAVSGLSPNESLHKFTAALEPKTGIPLDLAARIQLNMFLRQDKYFDVYKDVQNVLLPAFWFAMTVSIDETFASQVKLALSLPGLGFYVACGLFTVAVIIIVVGIVLSLTKSWVRSTQEDEEVLTDNMN